MAAADRPKLANYLSHEVYTLDTRDHMDHTFCGIMFDVCCRSTRPIEYIEITSFWVRGDLGPIKVFVVPDGFRDEGRVPDEYSNAVHKDPSAWELVFQHTLPESMETLQELVLLRPVQVRHGEKLGVYIHSSLPGDRGLVYDNQRGKVAHSDPYLQVLPGLAHVSCKPFGNNGPWQRGRAWRANRQFVGRLTYGVKWKLWNPDVHREFPSGFQRMAHCMAWAVEQPGSTLSPLPHEVLLYILNMCRWDWGKAFQPEEPEPEPTDVALARIACCGVAGECVDLDEATATPGPTGGIAGDHPRTPGEVTLMRYADFQAVKYLLAQYDHRAYFLDWGDLGVHLLLEGLPKEQLRPGVRLEFGPGGCVLELLRPLSAAETHIPLLGAGIATLVDGAGGLGAVAAVRRGGGLAANQPVYVRPPGWTGVPSPRPSTSPATSSPAAAEGGSPASPVVFNVSSLSNPRTLAKAVLKALRGSAAAVELRGSGRGAESVATTAALLPASQAVPRAIRTDARRGGQLTVTFGPGPDL